MSKFKHVSKYLAPLFGAAMLLSVAFPVQASSLTSAQISAIVSLLQAFNADPAVVANVQAQLSGQVAVATSSDTCVDLHNDLYTGKDDAGTSGEVSALQRFLITAGVYPEARITGYYGSLTAQAVVRWQKAHGMDFVTLASGVGTMTRTKMACSGTSSEAIGKITSISPVSGPLGTVVEVRGSGLSGFEGDSSLTFDKGDGSKTVLSDNSGNYSSTGDTLIRVTVKDPCKKGEQLMNPRSASGKMEICAYTSLTPGIYSVYANGWNRSNSVTFTITAN